MTIVIGLDQHRAQITYDLLDTETGEVKGATARRPESVRAFLGRFAAERVQAATEATTHRLFSSSRSSWRRVRRCIWLSRPRRASGVVGRSARRPDRADARRLRRGAVADRARCLSRVDPPTHILPGAPPRRCGSVIRLASSFGVAASGSRRSSTTTVCLRRPRQLLTGENRALAGRARPARRGPPAGPGRSGMVDQLRSEIEPIERDLRAYARRQPGCRALMSHYGIGELTASRSWPNSATFAASAPHVARSITPASTSPFLSPTSAALPVISPARGHRRSGGRSTRRRRSPGGRARPTAPTTNKRANDSAATAPASRSLANCSNAPTTASANSARRRSSRPDGHDARPSPTSADQPRPAPEDLLPPRACAGRPRKTERPHRSQRDHPITHHVAGPDNETVHRDKAGRPRAQTTRPATTRARTTHRQAPPPHIKPGHRAFHGTPGQKGEEMAKVIVMNWLTLDGVMQGPGRPDEDTPG